MRIDPNLAMLVEVATRLDALREEVVFVGGCATGLLITDIAAAPIRATTDVDVIVELATRSDWYALSARLRALGFREDTDDGAPLCRWVIAGIKLDVMPTDSAVLGFSNPWYPGAIAHAKVFTLPNGLTIRHVTAPYFLATKIEAFKGRGNNDFLASHDMEDFIAVLDGRPELMDELAAASQDLRHALSEELRLWLANNDFLEALPGHLPPDAASQARVAIIKTRLKHIANAFRPL